MTESDSLDLARQIELAGELLAKLERIKEVWDELPCEDQIKEMADHAESLRSSLESAREEVTHNDFPHEEGLDDLGKKAADLFTCLEQAREAYNADDFPTVDHLQELGKEAAQLAQALEDARE